MLPYPNRNKRFEMELYGNTMLFPSGKRHCWLVFCCEISPISMAVNKCRTKSKYIHSTYKYFQWNIGLLATSHPYPIVLNIIIVQVIVLFAFQSNRSTSFVFINIFIPRSLTITTQHSWPMDRVCTHSSQSPYALHTFSSSIAVWLLFAHLRI